MLTQEPAKAARSDVFVEEVVETPAWEQPVAVAAQVVHERKRLFAKIAEHDWIVVLFYVGCDSVCWGLCHGVVGYLGRVQFLTTAVELVLVDCIVVASIAPALRSYCGCSRA